MSTQENTTDQLVFEVEDFQDFLESSRTLLIPLPPPRISDESRATGLSASRSCANFLQLRSPQGWRFLHSATDFSRNCGTRSLNGLYTAGEGEKDVGQ